MNEDMFKENTCVFQASAEQKSLGKIMSVSNTVKTVFGHDPDKLIYQSIHMLMPSFI
jgi:hypothetical protein